MSTGDEDRGFGSCEVNSAKWNLVPLTFSVCSTLLMSLPSHVVVVVMVVAMTEEGAAYALVVIQIISEC